MTDPAESVDITSPIAWQRWLSIQLVRLRKAAGVKQADAAKAIGASVGKLSYLENGERPISVDELEKLFPLLGVPQDDRPAYVTAAKRSAEAAWWDAWSEEDLTRVGRRYVGLEDAATRIREYATMILPGLLQTADYARSVVGASDVPLAPEAIDSLVDLRMERQRRATGKSLNVVVDEATLHRQVGGPRVLREQLVHLLASVAEQPHVSLRVLPYSVGARPGIFSPFTILDFNWPGDPGIVHIENTVSSAGFIDDRSRVYGFSSRHRELTSLALDEAHSMALINSVAQEI